MKLRMLAKLFVSAPAALLAVVGTSGTADARSHAAILGNPGTGAQSNCFDFQTGFGSIKQVCAGTRTWIIAPIYDNAGGMTVRVSVFATAAGGVVCRARSVDHFGLGLINGTLATSTGRGLEELRSTVSAHGFGGVQTNCDMGLNTELINVQY